MDIILKLATSFEVIEICNFTRRTYLHTNKQTNKRVYIKHIHTYANDDMEQEVELSYNFILYFKVTF